eukprot:6466219-Amphidinium_carterae.3
MVTHERLASVACLYRALSMISLTLAIAAATSTCLPYSGRALQHLHIQVPMLVKAMESLAAVLQFFLGNSNVRIRQKVEAVKCRKVSNTNSGETRHNKLQQQTLPPSSHGGRCCAHTVRPQRPQFQTITDNPSQGTSTAGRSNQQKQTGKEMLKGKYVHPETYCLTEVSYHPPFINRPQRTETFCYGFSTYMHRSNKGYGVFGFLAVTHPTVLCLSYCKTTGLKIMFP